VVGGPPQAPGTSRSGGTAGLPRTRSAPGACGAGRAAPGAAGGAVAGACGPRERGG